jgi:hypothetical protein
MAALDILGVTPTEFALVWIGTGASSETRVDWMGFVPGSGRWRVPIGERDSLDGERDWLWASELRFL